MIDHIWTVICSQSVIDKNSNNISLQNVIEQLNIAGPHPSEETPGLIPIPFEVVSLFERVPNDQPVQGRSRLQIVSPSGDIQAEFETNIDLSLHSRSRSRGRFNGLQVKEGGRFQFRIQIRDEDEDEWRDVATIPLQISFEHTEGIGSTN